MASETKQSTIFKLGEDMKQYNANELATKLGKKQKAGAGWNCSCPAHDDKIASLTITDGKDSNPIFYCHAGCSFENIINALIAKGLWEKKTLKDINYVKSKNKEVVYNYTNADGATLYQKVRFGVKKFYGRQILPTGETIKGIPKYRVIYNLHEVIKARNDGTSIILCEGEKDANNLISLGYVATTIFEGGGKKWRPEYTEQLKDSILYLCPDNDIAGLEFINNAAGQLKDVVKSIKLIELPNLENKEDVSDWINKGGTKEQLDSLIESAQVYHPTKNTKPDGLLQNEYAYAWQLVESLGKDNIIFSRGMFYHWDYSGVWKAKDDREIIQLLHRLIPEKVTRALDNSVIELIKTECFKSSDIFDTKQNIINCLDCEVLVSDKGYEKRRHLKGSYSLSQIPFSFNPNAECPNFISALNEWFDGDADKEEKKQVIFEMLGYSLLATAKLEKFIILVGAGANGKSVLLDIVRELCGIKNTASVGILGLSQKFQRAYLSGKLANIVTELSQGCMIPDGELKSIVSGEPLAVEIKFKDPFDFCPYCTMWFATNHIPSTRDFSDALFRRAIILEFNNQFNDEKRDIHLKEKLRKELEGILYKSIIAITEVMRRGSFTEPSSSQKRIDEWKIESNPIELFIEDSCNLTPSAYVGSSKLYDAYVKWQDGCGAIDITQTMLVQRLKSFGVSTGKRYGERVLVGIDLK